MEFAIVSPPTHYVRPDAGAEDPGQTHVVRSGDTLYGIARQYGVPPADLIAANPQIANPDLIYPGDTVHVPVSGEEPEGCCARDAACAVEPPLERAMPFFPVVSPVVRVVHPALEPPVPEVRQTVEPPEQPSANAPAQDAGPFERLVDRWIERVAGFIDGWGPARSGPSYGPPAIADVARPGELEVNPLDPWRVQSGPLDQLDSETRARFPLDA